MKAMFKPTVHRLGGRAKGGPGQGGMVKWHRKDALQSDFVVMFVVLGEVI